MIPWINERFLRWAEWTRRRADNGLGYPKQSAFTRLSGAHRGQLFAGEYDQAAWQVESIVRGFPTGRRELIRMHYLGKGMARQKARTLGVPLSTYYQLLHVAHEATAGQIESERINARVNYLPSLESGI